MKSLKTLMAVVLLATMSYAQAPQPLIPMPGRGHKKLAIGLIVAGAGAVIAGVVVGGGSGKKAIPVKGGPVYPK